jgi:hypothetical protein
MQIFGAIFNTFDHIVKTCLKIFSVVGALDGALLHIIFLSQMVGVSQNVMLTGWAFRKM